MSTPDDPFRPTAELVAELADLTRELPATIDRINQRRADLVRELRDGYGIQIKALADEIGVHFTTLFKLIRAYPGAPIHVGGVTVHATPEP